MHDALPSPELSAPAPRQVFLRQRRAIDKVFVAPRPEGSRRRPILADVRRKFASLSREQSA
jgi:hypothetical protein